MLHFALYAIIEGLSGEEKVDPRLAVYLPQAREEGLQVATRVFPLVSEKSSERRCQDAVMLGYRGDFEQYRGKMREIHDQDAEALARFIAEQNALNANPGPVKVLRVSGHESWKIIEPN